MSNENETEGDVSGQTTPVDVKTVEVLGKTAPYPPSILRPGVPITEESVIHGRRADVA